MSLLLALALLQDEGFPLRVGARWTYTRDGEPAMLLDAAEGADTITLRIRGGSFFWATEDLQVSVGPKGLRKHADSLGEQVHPLKKPQLLLPPRLESGARWESDDGFFSAEVLAREEIQVPAGAYTAWKIGYVLESHLGTEEDFRAWYAPGTGFVRFEHWQQSERGKKSPLEKPYRLDLLRYQPERKAVPVAPPPLSAEARATAVAALARLADAAVDVREKAAAELAALGVGVTPLVRDALVKAEDPELRARLGRILERCPALVFTVLLAREKGKVGEPLPLRFSLRNHGALAVDVLPALDGSDDHRHPRYGLIVRDAEGVEQKPAEIPFCAQINPLLLRDFETLLPGEDIDPLGPGSFSHYMQSWKPSRPGVYTVDAVYDATGKFPDHWHVSAARREEILRRLGAMPRLRIAAPRLTLVVEE